MNNKTDIVDWLKNELRLCLKLDKTACYNSDDLNKIIIFIEQLQQEIDSLHEATDMDQELNASLAKQIETLKARNAELEDRLVSDPIKRYEKARETISLHEIVNNELQAEVRTLKALIPGQLEVCAKVDELQEVVDSIGEAKDFYDKVCNASESERIAVGHDHWDWILKEVSNAQKYRSKE